MTAPPPRTRVVADELDPQVPAGYEAADECCPAKRIKTGSKLHSEMLERAGNSGAREFANRFHI